MEDQKLYSDTGYLQVRAVTAGGALPLEQASVLILGADTENRLTRTALQTDRSGMTARVSLPTPGVGLSQVPGVPAPYATYNITVIKEGYYVHQSLRVPVFGGITAVQTAEMIPRSYSGSEAGKPIGLTENTESQDLGGGDE